MLGVLADVGIALQTADQKPSETGFWVGGGVAG